MPKITISYRRTESDATGRIYDRLVQRYGEESIFRDIDWIPFGVDFRKSVDEALGDADVLIAVVGPQWRGATDERSARIMEDNDLVRIEIETALKRDIPLIPVLIGGANMPKTTELPESIRDFSFRNAAAIDSGRNFNTDIERLMRSVDRLMEMKAKREAGVGRQAALKEKQERERQPTVEKERARKQEESVHSKTLSEVVAGVQKSGPIHSAVASKALANNLDQGHQEEPVRSVEQSLGEWLSSTLTFLHGDTARQTISGLLMAQAIARMLVAIYLLSRYQLYLHPATASNFGKGWIGLAAVTGGVAWGIARRYRWMRVPGIALCAIGALHDAFFVYLAVTEQYPEAGTDRWFRVLGISSTLYLIIDVASLIYLLFWYRPARVNA